MKEAENKEAEVALGNDPLRRQRSSVSSAAAASAWKQIQERMKPPKCKGHNEDCVIRQVKKKGPNFGEASLDKPESCICTQEDVVATSAGPLSLTGLRHKLRHLTGKILYAPMNRVS